MISSSYLKHQENGLFTLLGHIWVTSKQTKIELVPTETQLQGRPPGYMQTRLIADYRTKFDRADVQILEHAERWLQGHYPNPSFQRFQDQQRMR